MGCFINKDPQVNHIIKDSINITQEIDVSNNNSKNEHAPIKYIISKKYKKYLYEMLIKNIYKEEYMKQHRIHKCNQLK